MDLRPAHAGDAPVLARLMLDAIDGLATRAYRPDELAQWKGRIDPGGLRLQIEDPKTSFVVAERDGTIIGFGARAGNVLRYLYVHPSATGRGLGVQMMDHLEREARRAGIETIELDASRNAVPFYRRMGFAETVQGRCGVPDGILCTRMAKKILT